jgi:hypothetical protein
MSGVNSLIGGPPRRRAGFARGWFWTCLAAALTGGCSKPDDGPLSPLKPVQQWSRGIGPSEFGPYELIRAADGLKGWKKAIYDTLASADGWMTTSAVTAALPHTFASKPNAHKQVQRSLRDLADQGVITEDKASIGENRWAAPRT